MTQLRVFAVTLIMLVPILAPTAALAQPEQPTHTLKLFYWSANATVTTSSQIGNWSTGFWGLDYRFEVDSPLGFHLQYANGSQGSGGGAWSLTSGSDTIWFVDATYRWPTPQAIVRGFLGYGSLQYNSNLAPGNEKTTSSGFRIGVDASIPLAGMNSVVSNWSLNGSVAWYPGNSSSVTFTPGGTFSATNTASDWSISLQYTAPNQWVVEGGYRGATFVRSAGPVGGACSGATPCTFQWTGLFLTVGRTLP